MDGASISSWSQPFRVGVILKLAFRNLRRQLRRSLLTASAMVVGGFFCVFSYSLGDGTHEQWIESGVRMGSGHVTVERPEFRLSRKLDDRLSPEVRQATEQALQSRELAAQVVAVSSRLTISGLASSATGARPVQVVGVDPVAEAGFSMVDDQVIEGRYLEPDDRLAAYVGLGLVESLDLRLGSRFVVQAQDAAGDISGQLLRVVGIFRSGMPEADQSIIHIPLLTAGDWLGTDRDVTNVGVVLADSTLVGSMVADLERALSDSVASNEVRVMGWPESERAVWAAVTIDEFGNHVVMGILFIIIAFGIVNTVLMSVLHRYREFGVLRALGLTPRQTGAVVLVEGLTLTAISGCAGVLLGMVTTWYFFGDGLDFSVLVGEEMTFSGVVIDPVIVPLFRVSRLAQVFTVILGIGTIASIYPARRAATVDTAEAMKFDR
jgi:ABC-type lipoprotein release transport system permease subunit